MVEMIPHADTLRKIQVEHGVTGSFKDRPLADWLQKHNPSEEQYDKVCRSSSLRRAGDFTSLVPVLLGGGKLHLLLRRLLRRHLHPGNL